MTTNPTDPAAAKTWQRVYSRWSSAANRADECVAFIQAYGDQREADARADERAAVAVWLKRYAGLLVKDQETALLSAAEAIQRLDHMKGSG